MSSEHSGKPSPDSEADRAGPGGQPPESGEEDGPEIRLKLSKDRMCLYLDCDATGADSRELAEAILARLIAFGVRKAPGIDRLHRWLREQVERSPRLESVPVLEGVPPVQPIDGRIDWGGDFFTPGFVVDEETGRVNFRKHAANRSVEEGQRLATVLDPVPGQNGADVTGRPLRVRRPRKQRLRAGANVHEDPDSATFYAARAGRFRLNQNTVSVDEVYEIRGDVGLKTGDISHRGAVLVHRDVLAGTRLEAVGDIDVLGVVDGAHVQTGGALHVRGGITGAAGARVIAAGGVHAKFILDAEVQSSGDVVVEREILHTQINTLGALYVPKGRVAGGRVAALGGIDVGQAGSPSSARTELVAGEDYGLEGRVEILKNQLMRLEENVKKIRGTIAPMKGKIASLPAKSKDAIRILLSKLPAMEASIESLHDEIEEERAHSRNRARPIILIRKRLFPDTHLEIHGETYHAREEAAGPVRPAMVDGHVRLVPTRMQSLAGGVPEKEAAAESAEAGDENEA